VVIPKESEFERIYQSTLAEISATWTEEMQQEVARHNVVWRSDRTNFYEYLRCSLSRYLKAYRSLETVDAKSVCDVGGFLGVFPVTLSRMGFDVAMTESRTYYSNAFDAVFEFIAAEGVDIVDLDFFSESVEPPTKEYDAVTLMAVLEHFPHSHRQAMLNVRKLMGASGHLYVEVPNIAYWPKRWGMLRGRSPLVAVEDKFDSAVPFIGHHHEFTAEELNRLVTVAGFVPMQQWLFNYSRPRIDSWQKLRWRVSPAGWGENVADVIYKLSPSCRECIAVLCNLKHTAEASSE
jgi:2-polyprenyl-3-methyl-5-hydroxy-6-metoxy-1,4-benzoquinol methylase